MSITQVLIATQTCSRERIQQTGNFVNQLYFGDSSSVHPVLRKNLQDARERERRHSTTSDAVCRTNFLSTRDARSVFNPPRTDNEKILIGWIELRARPGIFIIANFVIGHAVELTNCFHRAGHLSGLSLLLNGAFVRKMRDGNFASTGERRAEMSWKCATSPCSGLVTRQLIAQWHSHA